MSVDDIREQLAQIEQSRADLEVALERRHQEAKTQVAQQVRDLILENGYDLNEIVPLISARRRRGPAAKPKTKKVVNTNKTSYTRYVDPQDAKRSYTRGVLPGWMKQRMQEQGYDPTSKQDRDTFKTKYLTRVEG